MTTTDLSNEFRARYNREPEALFFCPGRVNLIGEHIDYNGGRVMPCAISRGTYLAIAKNMERKINFHALNFPETVSLPLQEFYTKTGAEWYNYPLGIIHYLLQNGHAMTGIDFLFYGDLPIGSGLSSSASIEVLTAFALSEMLGLNISRKDIALLSKKTENDFIGVNSGIMDQFAVALGEEGQAILLNCDTLGYEYIPFEIGNFVLAIINSRKDRKLTDSKYNERFDECQQALQLLQTELKIDNLCELSSEQLEANLGAIDDIRLEKRAMHVVKENERVTQAANVLRSGDIAKFGELMYASHRSLQELYQVSGTELDTIVEFCKDYPDCIGARMTGAGFGGCAIALVRKESFEDFAQKLGTYYEDKIGYAPETFASAIGNGVHAFTVRQ